MNYKITYSTVCNTGRVRSINQDNLWCAGQFLKEHNNALDSSISGSTCNKEVQVFAVFDGMGGEQQGETAAYIAANAFNQCVTGLQKGKTEKQLVDIFFKMNSKICEYKSEHDIGGMGTTGAVLLFKKNKVYGCNIGDSRIYRLHRKRFTRLSHDHCLELFDNGKPPLTQYLGVPKTEFVIQPHLIKARIKFRERYLICSDGLTDMVCEDDIKSVLMHAATVDECSNYLLKMALDNGGRDNITIIVCEIQKK